MVSCSVLKEMVYKMEHQLEVETKAKRQHLRLRLDAGFGTDDNINFSLWRGYNILAKVSTPTTEAVLWSSPTPEAGLRYSQKRAKSLAKSVTEWVAVPSYELRISNYEGRIMFVRWPHTRFH
jgi:hypothetical protein